MSTLFADPALNPRPSRGLLAGIVVFVVLFSAAGYGWLGSREGWGTEPGTAAPPAAAAQGEVDMAQFEPLVARLAERLKAQPDNFDGWLVLARSYRAMHRPAEAAAAFGRAAALHPDDAALAAERAEMQRLAQAAPARAPAAASAFVAGTVSLAPALKDRASPDDSVFVFARAAEGPKMPLAILRLRVRDLPAAFRFDDASAMNPALPLSSAGSVVVGARVSRSGQAVAQPGDVQGFAPAGPLGRADLRIEIAELVP